MSLLLLLNPTIFNTPSGKKPDKNGIALIKETKPATANITETVSGIANTTKVLTGEIHE